MYTSIHQCINTCAHAHIYYTGLHLHGCFPTLGLREGVGAQVEQLFNAVHVPPVGCMMQCCPSVLIRRINTVCARACVCVCVFVCVCVCVRARAGSISEVCGRNVTGSQHVPHAPPPQRSAEGRAHGKGSGGPCLAGTQTWRPERQASRWCPHDRCLRPTVAALTAAFRDRKS